MGRCVRGYSITYFSVGATGLQVTSAIPGFETCFFFLFQVRLMSICVCAMFLVSSRNLADCPSRHLSRQDASLSPSLWDSVHLAYGGENDYSVDHIRLFLPKSALVLDGSSLPFSPLSCSLLFWHLPFAQDITEDLNGVFSNPYAFPPIFLVSYFLRFLFRSHHPFTIVVPDVSPRKVWRNRLRASASSSFLLAPKGSVGALLIPSNEDFSPERGFSGFAL